MQWKVVVSRAGAEAAKMPDPSDWADLLSPGTDLTRAVAIGEGGLCPRCHRHPVEHQWQIFADEPATTPERVTGPVFVMCLCRNLYRYEGVHSVRADQAVGDATVRAASELKPIRPFAASDVTLEASARLTLAATGSLVVTPNTENLRFGR